MVYTTSSASSTVLQFAWKPFSAAKARSISHGLALVKISQRGRQTGRHNPIQAPLLTELYHHNLEIMASILRSRSCLLSSYSRPLQRVQLRRQFNSAAVCLNPAEKEDSTNVWKLTQNDEEYWKGYLSTRPKYSDDFYNRIYDYHASNAGASSFSVAHDVGAGPGQVSVKLASRFSNVVVSDNNANHVDYAKYALSPTKTGFPESRFSYSVSTGEEIYSKFPPASADLIVCALMFPLMDTAAALHSFRSLLKPNGTLAIWFYSRAHFAEPEYAQKCQPLLDRIINHHFGKVIQGGGPQHTAGWRRTANGIASWLDNVPFAESEWHSVQRRKWNKSWTDMGFFGQDACNFPLEPVSNVKDCEVVTEVEDRGLWRKDWNSDQLKKFVDHIFPFPSIDEEPVKHVWEELIHEMGGVQAQRAFSWPLVLILASKK